MFLSPLLVLIAKIVHPFHPTNTCPRSYGAIPVHGRPLGQSVSEVAKASLSPTTRRKNFFLPREKRNVALLPVTYLNFVYTRILHPAPTSPDLLPLYRPLAEESIGISHLHPSFSFSSFSIFLSLLLYLFFRKDILIYIYIRARYTESKATGNKATFPLNRRLGYMQN